jgi:hypothetical protein
MLLVYPQGIRIVVHTANLIHVDWNYKSQGLWMQDFPWKDTNDMNNKVPFENDLVDYLSALKVTGCFLWPIVNLLKFVFFLGYVLFFCSNTQETRIFIVIGERNTNNPLCLA